MYTTTIKSLKLPTTYKCSCLFVRRRIKEDWKKRVMNVRTWGGIQASFLGPPKNKKRNISLKNIAYALLYKAVFDCTYTVFEMTTVHTSLSKAEQSCKYSMSNLDCLLLVDGNRQICYRKVTFLVQFLDTRMKFSKTSTTITKG